MASSRAAVRSRSAGRHRRPSRARVVVPTGVTGGILLATAASGVAAAAPAAASETAGGGGSTTSSSSAGASQASHTSTDLPAYPGAYLDRGDTGGHVKDVQAELGVATDGIFGPVTEAAVMQFQRKHGLAVDGVVGPNTWAELRGGGSFNYNGGGGNAKFSLVSSTESTSSLGERAVEIASQQEGEPYIYGAAGPGAFDCSGLVKYVFGNLGHSLPHNADMQYDVVQHVSHSNLQPGDIVFLSDGGGEMYHNGIYAGNGKWWVARNSGTTVTLQDAYWMDGGYSWHVGRVG